MMVKAASPQSTPTANFAPVNRIFVFIRNFWLCRQTFAVEYEEEEEARNHSEQTKHERPDLKTHPNPNQARHHDTETASHK
mmetsp:Transcript_1999/g.6048  ORF Transcript_1999/g.6048 Transcript_1999/m.6048 type:complete len:81 (-) Transcript_1999:507-749(-)